MFSAASGSLRLPPLLIKVAKSCSLTLATSAYSGATPISTATYQWAKYEGGKWVNISNATASTLTVAGADIVNIQSYRCTMTYGGQQYTDVITVEDKSDPYVSEMNITVRRSRQSGVARATCPDQRSHLLIVTQPEQDLDHIPLSWKGLLMD